VRVAADLVLRAVAQLDDVEDLVDARAAPSPSSAAQQLEVARPVR
jgi:hypothetical protein